MIDPAQSFSQALGQGLGIIKSYRDEARQDEDRAFAKDLAIRNQNITEERNLRDRERFGWDTENRRYDVETLRPLRERGLIATTQGAETNLEMAKLEAEDLPNEINRRAERHTSDIESARTSRAATRQGVRQAAQRFNWEAQDRKALEEARSFRAWYTSESPDAPDLSGTPWSPLNFMGSLSNGRRVADIFSSSSWLQGSSTEDRRAMAAFATPVRGGFEQRYGMVPNSSSMIDFKQVGDKISPLVAGISSKTGKLVYKWGKPQEANRLFSKAAARSQAQRAIAEDPQAQIRLTQMWAQDDPRGFQAARQQAEASAERNISALKVAAEKRGAKPEDITAYQEALRNYDGAVLQALWSIGSNAGARSATRPLYLAYEVVRETNPDIEGPLDALTKINEIAANRRGELAAFYGGRGKAPPTGLSRAELVQAIIRELAADAD